MSMTTFTPMHSIIPEGEKGAFKISHFEIGKPTLRMALGKEPHITPGKYVQLVQMDGNFFNRIWMSDTDNEQSTNRGVVLNAKGDVLIAGLGIGMILLPIMRKPEVKSVTVIEKYQEVFDLVVPHLKGAISKAMAERPGDPSFSVEVADIYTWEPPKGKKWDCIYFDIWGDQSTDCLKEMTKLKRRFARRKREGGWMGCWREGHLRLSLARERHSGW